MLRVRARPIGFSSLPAPSTAVPDRVGCLDQCGLPQFHGGQCRESWLMPPFPFLFVDLGGIQASDEILFRRGQLSAPTLTRPGACHPPRECRRSPCVRRFERPRQRCAVRVRTPVFRRYGARRLEAAPAFVAGHPARRTTHARAPAPTSNYGIERAPRPYRIANRAALESHHSELSIRRGGGATCG